MRPDPDSDLAGAESEYGDDTGFAAEATRTGTESTETSSAAETDSAAGSAGEVEDTTIAAGPGDGAD